MPIVVTGGGGMVGRHLINQLKNEKYSNVISPSSDELDLRERSEVKKFFIDHDPAIVIHLAARVGGIQANRDYPSEFLSDNVLIGCNLLYGAHEAGVKKLINLGSSCMYPRECPQPMKEDYLLTGVPEPTNEGYALAKTVTAKLCQYLHQQYNNNFYSLVPSNLYGPFDSFNSASAHVISALIKKCHEIRGTNSPLSVWGTGEARREFLYVEDCAKAIVYFMENVDADDLGHNYLNIGSGKDIAIFELATKIRDIVCPENPIVLDETKPDGMPKKCLDVSRLQQWSWKPIVQLEEGIKLTYDYFLDIL